MAFVWNAAKARDNQRKHGVSFDDAVTVFADPLAATGADPEHSLGEERWLTFGLSRAGQLLVVSHLEQNGHVRIISARRATNHEREIYEKG